MRSDLIVGRYTLQDLLSSLFKSELAGVEVKLPFDDTVDALGKRIFIGVSVLGHADRYCTRRKYIDILFATILGPSVGVVDQGLILIGSIG